jgi:hypothetical protein
VSKPSIITTGKIGVGNMASINMNYVQGRKAGSIPTTTATFDNPLGFDLVPDRIGMFTYVGGKWTLTSVQQS